MLAYFERPMNWSQLAAVGLLVLAGGAAYCFIYTLLQGDFEHPLIGAAWAAANMLPWLAAFEIGKRFPAPSRNRIAALLAGAALVSLVLEVAFGLIEPESASDVAFEMLRRLPGAVLVLFLILVPPAWRARNGRRGPADAGNGVAELPLLAHQIDWIKAAGNYLEFHCAVGLVMRRMTMAQAEALLRRHDFVRIHRSIIVNASRIARIRRGKLIDEVELIDGRLLKVGAAYRASLALLERHLAA